MFGTVFIYWPRSKTLLYSAHNVNRDCVGLLPALCTTSDKSWSGDWERLLQGRRINKQTSSVNSNSPSQVKAVLNTTLVCSMLQL